MVDMNNYITLYVETCDSLDGNWTIIKKNVSNERSKWSYECQTFNSSSNSWHQDFVLNREEFPIANSWFRHRIKSPLPPKWQKQFFRVVAHCHVADGYFHHCMPEKCRVIFAAYDGRVFLSVQPLRDQPIHNIDSQWWRL